MTDAPAQPASIRRPGGRARARRAALRRGRRSGRGHHRARPADRPDGEHHAPPRPRAHRGRACSSRTRAPSVPAGPRAGRARHARRSSGWATSTRCPCSRSWPPRPASRSTSASGPATRYASSSTSSPASRCGSTRSPVAGCRMHVSAMGKCLLAAGGDIDDQIDALGDLVRATHRTITDRDQLRAELELVRERGWALNDEERNPGVRAIAAPVRHPGGDGRSAPSPSRAPRSASPTTGCPNSPPCWRRPPTGSRRYSSHDQASDQLAATVQLRHSALDESNLPTGIVSPDGPCRRRGARRCRAASWPGRPPRTPVAGNNGLARDDRRAE